jgi:hypothetical protein
MNPQYAALWAPELDTTKRILSELSTHRAWQPSLVLQHPNEIESQRQARVLITKESSAEIRLRISLEDKTGVMLSKLGSIKVLVRHDDSETTVMHESSDRW